MLWLFHCCSVNLRTYYIILIRLILRCFRQNKLNFATEWTWPVTCWSPCKGWASMRCCCSSSWRWPKVTLNTSDWPRAWSGSSCGTATIYWPWTRSGSATSTWRSRADFCDRTSSSCGRAKARSACDRCSCSRSSYCSARPDDSPTKRWVRAWSPFNRPRLCCIVHRILRLRVPYVTAVTRSTALPGHNWPAALYNNRTVISYMFFFSVTESGLVRVQEQYKNKWHRVHRQSRRQQHKIRNMVPETQAGRHIHVGVHVRGHQTGVDRRVVKFIVETGTTK